MREHGLADQVQVETADYTDDGGYRATVRLLRAAQPPTAIFTVDDVVCLGAKAAAAEFGLSVPDDLSLVGYDNSPLARLRSIWLTSVDSGGAEVGRLAARTLAARIDARRAPRRCTCWLRRSRCAGPPALRVDMRARRGVLDRDRRAGPHPRRQGRRRDAPRNCSPVRLKRLVDLTGVRRETARRPARPHRPYDGEPGVPPQAARAVAAAVERLDDGRVEPTESVLPARLVVAARPAHPAPGAVCPEPRRVSPDDDDPLFLRAGARGVEHLEGVHRFRRGNGELGLAAERGRELGVVGLVGALLGRHRHRARGGVQRAPAGLGVIAPCRAEVGRSQSGEDGLRLHVGSARDVATCAAVSPAARAPRCGSACSSSRANGHRRRA